MLSIAKMECNLANPTKPGSKYLIYKYYLAV